MRSIACAACGTVRWDSSLRCPECGSANRLPEPPTSVVTAPPAGPRRRILNVPWREVPDPQRSPPLGRRKWIEEGVALGIVAALLIGVYLYDAGRSAAPVASPQILEGNGQAFPELARGASAGSIGF